MIKSRTIILFVCFFLCSTSLLLAVNPRNGKYYLSSWTTYPQIHSALSELNNSPTQVTLVIDNSSTLNQSETVKPNVTLEFPGGGNILTVPAGNTLTIQSPVIAGFYQIFDNGTTTGRKIVPGEKHIEWWGAVTDNGSGTSVNQQVINTNAFQEALDNQGLITFTSGVYVFDNTTRMNSHTILQGSGKTELKWTHNGVGIDFYLYTHDGWLYEQHMENWAIRDLSLEGAHDGYAGELVGGNNVGLLVGANSDSSQSGANDAAQWGGAHVERVVFYNWGNVALKFDSYVWSMDVESCRFQNVYTAISVQNNFNSSCTGMEISKCVFNKIGGDCLYAGLCYSVKFGPGNMTESNIKGYYTHLVGSMNPYVYGNRLEGQDNRDVAAFGHRWDNVTGGTFKGGNNEENIYLGGACVYNDIEVSSTPTTCGNWKPGVTGGSPGVYEDVINGCRDNRIVMLGGNTGYGVLGYSANAIDIKSEVHPIDKSATPITISRTLTDNISNPNPGTYLLDTATNNRSITINLPCSFTNPFAEWTFRYMAKAGTCQVTIVPVSNGIDTGKVDNYSGNYTLRNVGDQITLRPVPELHNYPDSNWLTYLSANWYSLNKQLTNTFTIDNVTYKQINDSNIRISSNVIFYPINAEAAKVQGSQQCLYFDTTSAANGSFTVRTASGSATGTTGAQYRYIVN